MNSHDPEQSSPSDAPRPLASPPPALKRPDPASPALPRPLRIARLHAAIPERGLAVLLALVAVGAAAILTLALASTRDSALTTSSSIARVASARMAAAGSLDLACAVIDQHGLSGFAVSSDTSPSLFQPVTVGGTTYSADIYDLVTGSPITTDSAAVRIVARGQRDGVTQVATATGRLVQPDIVVRADLDLSEFGLLATSGQPGAISFSESSSLGIWPKSPMALLREPVMIGSSQLVDGSVSVDATSLLRGYTVLTQGTFPATDEEYAETVAKRECPIPHPIHVPESPRPGRSGYAYELDLASRNLDALNYFLNPPQGDGLSFPAKFVESGGSLNVIGSIDLHTSGTLEVGDVPSFLAVGGAQAFGDWRTVDISGDLRLGPGDVIQIMCPTLIIVRGDLDMIQACISVDQGAPLTIVVFGQISLLGSSIRPNENRYQGDDGPALPRGKPAIVLFGTMDGRPSLSDPTPSDRSIVLDQGSTFDGEIYAPSRAIHVLSQSQVLGRALGYVIQFAHGSRFYYEPMLNDGRGWSNPLSGIWENESTPRADVLAVAELNDMGLSVGTGTDGLRIISEAPPDGPHIAVNGPPGGIFIPASAALVGGNAYQYIAECQSELATITPMSDALNGNGPEVIRVGAILRDFQEARSPTGHPDFAAIEKHRRIYERLVQPTLDESGRLRFGSPDVKTTSYKFGAEEVCWSIAETTDVVEAFIDHSADPDSDDLPPVKSEESFAAWFREKPGLNMSRPILLAFEQHGNSGHFTLTIDERDGKHPAKGRLFGDLAPLSDPRAGTQPNGHFTVEMALNFRRIAGGPGGDQVMRVISNGEVWIYLNGVLVTELGAYEGSDSRGQKIPLGRLGLREGEIGEIRIFYAHRGISNPQFELFTTFPIWQAEGFIADGDPRESFTNPELPVTALGSMENAVRYAKATGRYADEPTTYAERSGNWTRTMHMIETGTNSDGPPTTIPPR